MRTFSDLRLRLDPWQTEYGGELPASVAGADDESVDLAVEHAPEAWQPVTPGTVEIPPVLVFADGVRRIDARVVGRTGVGIVHGAFGSFAVGSVRVAAAKAEFGRYEVHRVLSLGAGASLDEPVHVARALAYRPFSVADDAPDAPGLAIHGEMRRCEERFARELADASDTLVLQDGPLTFAEPVRGQAVGYVKRIQRLYLPASHLGHLVALGPGQRTPLFALRGTSRFARYAWFVRLSSPRLGDSELSGLVRCEVADHPGVEAARHLADAATVILPAYAGIRGLHARAPQNLLPVAALENRLRHALGDPALVLRAVQDTLSREARHVGSV